MTFNIEKVKITDEKFEKIWQSYEEMSKEKRIEIETQAYEEFLKEIGQVDTKLNKAIFDKTKKNHIAKLVEKITQSNEEKNDKISSIHEIKEIFESLSMFLFEVMRELEAKEIMDYQKIVQIIPVLGEFQGTINGKKIKIKYNEGTESIISIN